MWGKSSHNFPLITQLKGCPLHIHSRDLSCSKTWPGLSQTDFRKLKHQQVLEQSPICNSGGANWRQHFPQTLEIKKSVWTLLVVWSGSREEMQLPESQSLDTPALLNAPSLLTNSSVSRYYASIQHTVPTRATHLLPFKPKLPEISISLEKKK